MVAGVSTIDMVLLVIAADDGVMPQTKEHFEILQLLGVKKGLVVLTKIDLVDKDWMQLVIEDVKNLIDGTFLEVAPIVPVSGVTGEGISELKQLILELIQEIEVRPDKGLFRLWIDRVFSIKGSGTIIAGTVLSGSCKPGDTVELLPQQQRLRVRRVQVHNKSLEKCIVGERAAINLMDIDKTAIDRGNMLAEPGYYQPTFMLNARLHLLKSCPGPLKNRARVRFHIGTGEIIARLVLLERKDLLPGEFTFAQFRLESPCVAGYGDQYVIRSFSPERTIGGGTIVDVHPPKLKYLPEKELEQYTFIEEGDPTKIVEQYLIKNKFILKTVKELAEELSFNPKVVQEALETLKNQKLVTVITDKPEWAVIHTLHFDRGQLKIIDFLKEYHNEYPMLSGIKKSEINERIFGKVPTTLLDAILDPLLKSDKIKIKEEKIFLSGHTINFSPEQEEIKKKVEEIYLRREYITPGWDEIVHEVEGRSKEISNVVRGLIELGILVEIKYYEKPSIFHKKCLDRAKEILLAYFNKHDEIRLGEFREMINSTRKFATPILVYFDKLKITERDGDIRRIMKK
jgi:selenocysteine-specific elongation factor